MARRMRDAAFRLEQEENRYAARVKPINDLVDDLRKRGGRGWLPYVAPCHGGVDATILSVLRDPGPKTQDGVGSGFLCIENDDPTAERQAQAFADVGIGIADVTPWNAYPWYINRKPTRREIEAGIEPLHRLLPLLSHLKVVFLQGGDAQVLWQLYKRANPEHAESTRWTVVKTIHPGRQALWTSDPTARAARISARARAYQQVAELICP